MSLEDSLPARNRCGHSDDMSADTIWKGWATANVLRSTHRSHSPGGAEWVLCRDGIFTCSGENFARAATRGAGQCQRKNRGGFAPRPAPRRVWRAARHHNRELGAWRAWRGDASKFISKRLAGKSNYAVGGFGTCPGAFLRVRSIERSPRRDRRTRSKNRQSGARGACCVAGGAPLSLVPQYISMGD